MPMLTGQFSKTQLAQPVRNLSVNSSDEMVTFKIVNNQSPSLFKALWQWYSLSKNIYLIFPILGGLSYFLSQHEQINVGLIVSSFLALQFFLLSLTLLNDYSDYVNGVDRINEYQSQKPLVQGLIRPFQAWQLAIGFLGLAFLSALYCFFIKPFVLVMALAGLVIGFGLFSTFISRQFKGLSLVATFLLGGPLLVLGYEYLLFDQMTLASALLGSVFGYHALKYDFCRQMRDIFYSSKARLKTLSSLLGFEKSKFIYTIMSILHLAVLAGFVMNIGQASLMLILLVSVGFEAYINYTLYRAPSFLSSNMNHCMSLQKFHYTLECSLIVFIFLSPQWLSLF